MSGHYVRQFFLKWRSLRFRWCEAFWCFQTHTIDPDGQVLELSHWEYAEQPGLVAGGGGMVSQACCDRGKGFVCHCSAVR